MAKKLGAVAGVLVFLGVVLLFSYWGFQNTCNRFENAVVAKYTDNRNVYDNGWKEVREKAQVPAMYEEQLRRLYSDVLSNRYGEKGAQQLVLFVQEQNPQLPPEVYVQIQQSVEAFRRRFQQNQTELVSIKQEYSNYLTATYSGRFFNQFGHYPRIDMAKYDIVTSEQTEKAFDTKKADELKLQ